ncbi:MAG: hypothetical protein LQ342_000794 [Letrouitia transgressa]|nr:MAG: hypothetical protein LQ342_000794 [Letrouitia transgressa]
MLHEFHTYQNSRKPGSIHATYLVSGQLAPLTPASPPTRPIDGQDTHMQSSPFRSSPLPDQDGTEVKPLLKTITLVREEQLDVFRKDSTEDLISIGKQYGVIQNSRVKLKQLQRRTIIEEQGVDPNAKQSAKFAPKVVKQEPNSKAITPSSSLSKRQTPAPSDPKSFTQPEQAKKNEKNQGPRLSGIKKEPSNIFKAFSKPKAKLESEKANSGGETRQETSKHETKTKRTHSDSDEDEPMKDASEDEQSEDFTESTTKAQQTSQSRRKAKLQREEQLRKMMDDDEDDDDVPPNSQHQAEEPDTADTPAPLEETPADIAPAAGSTRRRGRRKVMKKKMLKDEEGYLGEPTFPPSFTAALYIFPSPANHKNPLLSVTKEEPVWESFSEDEPAPKARLPASTDPTPASKGRKSAGGKAEQGNIMSFFGKK